MSYKNEFLGWERNFVTCCRNDCPLYAVMIDIDNLNTFPHVRYNAKNNYNATNGLPQFPINPEWSWWNYGQGYLFDYMV